MSGGSGNETARADGRRRHSQSISCSIAVAMVVFPLAVPGASAQSIRPDVLERVKHATVMVKTSWSKSTEGDTPLGSGSGFFVNATGICITNDHVTDPGHGKNRVEKMEIWQKYNRLTWRVVTDSGTDEEAVYSANVLYSNDQADMAVMQVLDEDGEFLETPNYLAFRPSGGVEPKTKLWDLGFPGGENLTRSRDRNPPIRMQSGNVIELSRSPGGRIKGITTNILVNQGNSGGPVVDVDGRLVGIATLAGGGDGGRSAIAILIPADLTMEMIRVAFEERKIPAGVDVEPFLDVLTDAQRVFQIPTTPRREDYACMTLEEGGGVICGASAEKDITWPTLLGDITVPSALCAYVLCDEDDEYGTVLLDGGDRFRIVLDKAVVPFTPTGGESRRAELNDDIASIAFALPQRQPEIPSGKVFLIGGADFHLALKDPSGDVKFDSAAGEVSIPIEQVTRIEETDGGDIGLHTNFGAKMIGSFVDHMLEGTLAWTGTRIKFSFKDITNAELRIVDFDQLAGRRELRLSDSLSTTDNRLVKLAGLLDAGDLAAAKPSLAEIVERDVFNKLSKQKKEEVGRLEGEVLMRSGEYEAAHAAFRKLLRADVEDVRWHANARCAMLERFADGRFEGGKISEVDVFERAAEVLADEHTREARRAIEEMESRLGFGADAAKRTEYLKLVRRADQTEESLLIANRLRGGATEELLVRLWRDLADLHAIEISRLRIERQSLQEDSSGDRDAPESKRRQVERKLERFDGDVEKAAESYGEAKRKLSEAGFIIDDSDRDMRNER